MNATIIITLLGLVAAISWGISDFFCAKSAKSIGPILAAVLVNVLGSVGFAVIYLFLFRNHPELSRVGLVYAVISGAFLALGAASFFVGLEKGPVSIVSPLTSTYPLVVTVLALLVFHAQLSIGQMAGIFLVVVGVIAASGLLTMDKSKRKITKGPMFALLAALMWGIGYALLAQSMKHGNWQTVSLVEFSSVALMMLAMLPFIKGEEKISKATFLNGVKSRFIIGAAIIQLLGVLALNIGLARSTGNGGTIIVAVSACYPILTIFLALKHFDEKVGLVPLSGALLGIAGIVVLSL